MSMPKNQTESARRGQDPGSRVARPGGQPILSIPLRELARQLARDGAMIDLLHVVDAGEDHRGVELALEDADRACHAGLSARAEAIEKRPPDHTGIGAERERAENVLAGAHAGI